MPVKLPGADVADVWLPGSALEVSPQSNAGRLSKHSKKHGNKCPLSLPPHTSAPAVAARLAETDAPAAGRSWPVEALEDGDASVPLASLPHHSRFA